MDELGLLFACTGHQIPGQRPRIAGVPQTASRFLAHFPREESLALRGSVDGTTGTWRISEIEKKNRVSPSGDRSEHPTPPGLPPTAPEHLRWIGSKYPSEPVRTHDRSAIFILNERMLSPRNPRMGPSVREFSGKTRHSRV